MSNGIVRAGFFTPEFLKSLPSDNLVAAVELAREFERFNASAPDVDYQAESINFHDDYVEALAIFRAFSDARSLSLHFGKLTFGGNKRENIKLIRNSVLQQCGLWKGQLDTRTANSLFGEKSDSYAALFNSEQIYEFSDDDILRVQKLTNELRDLISSSNLITADHKRRLLRRLEAMQQEIHKHTSDIDRFWGFIAEAGIVARKFGEDLKPITDRVSEIANIVISVIKLKEGVGALPEIPKFLQIADAKENSSAKPHVEGNK